MHYWVSEGFHEQNIVPGQNENFCKKWEAEETDRDDLYTLKLASAPTGEGLLMDVVKSYVMEDSIKYEYPYGTYLYPELHKLSMEAYYSNSGDEVIMEGPDASPVIGMKMFFTCWLIGGNDAEE